MWSDRSSPRAYIMLLVTMALWAGNSIVGRLVRDAIPPFTLAFGRWAIATLVLMAVTRGGVRREWRAAGAGWLRILALALLGVALFNALLYNGLHHTTATNALLLQASSPAMVLIIERVLLRTRTGIWQVLGVILSIFGVAVVVLHGNLLALGELDLGTGDTMILTAAGCWAGYTVMLGKGPPVSQSLFLLLSFAIGTLAMAPFAVHEWREGFVPTWTAGTIAAFVYVGVLPSVVAFYLYNEATRVLGPARAGQALTLMPLFGALLSALLLGEVLTFFHLAGMALILAGIVVTVWANRGMQTVVAQERSAR